MWGVNFVITNYWDSINYVRKVNKYSTLVALNYSSDFLNDIMSVLIVYLYSKFE